MAWIKVYQSLERHPKVLDLSQRTGWNQDETIGKLVRFWLWVVDYAEDGDLSKYTPHQIFGHIAGNLSAEKVHQCMTEAKFITKNMMIHDWLDYAGGFLYAKYHSSNPKRIRQIGRKHKDSRRISKGRLKSDREDKIRRDKKDKIYNNKESTTSPALEKILFKDRVYMTKEQYQALVNDYGVTVVKDYIERLNDYGEQSPQKFKKYASHSATIRNWLRNDNVKKKVQTTAPVPQGKRFDPNVSSLVNETAKKLKGVS